ncbi:MAG: tRNA 5-hydroxyuridine modification protein YegQ [Thiohalomonadaceae bacterium]
MKTPELLAPAGSLRHLRVALAYGADAVYAGLPRYSLRVRNNDFDLDNLATGIQEAHALGRQFFLASNVMPHNAKVKTFMADMAPVIALRPDALIMADPGLILMVRERWPEMPVHLSVQANTVNYADVRFWQRQGITRVILSRELSLEEVAEIRQQCPDMELEVFVHGALCIAYSGRCLLSGYFNHRDPNQGTCTNACRWDYQVHEAEVDAGGDVRRAEAQKVYLLEQREHAGELMPIEEDEHGTYIMNSKDLRAVEHIAELVRIGVDSLKIEGRTKSPYYIARTTQAYRQAIDDAVAGRPFDTRLLAELENLANRGYTDGFYVRHHTQDYQNYIKGASSGERQQYVGEVDGYDAATGLAEIDVKNKIRVGDHLELITPQGNRRFVLERMEGRNGAALDEAPGGGHRVRIPLPAGDYRFALLAKEL